MFSSKRMDEMEARFAALDRVQAIIEFNLTGHILAANQNFLNAMGYKLPEIVNVVTALESIRSSVDTMRSNVSATAAAIEEQTAVTRDMSQNMQGTARDVHTISDNIAAITAAVKQVSAAVATTRDAAKVLAR